MDLLARIRSFSELGPNWDGYGGKPIDPRALQMARLVCKVLPPGAWTVCAHPHGGVIFEEEGGLTVEILP